MKGAEANLENSSTYEHQTDFAFKRYEEKEDQYVAYAHRPESVSTHT